MPNKTAVILVTGIIKGRQIVTHLHPFRDVPLFRLGVLVQCDGEEITPENNDLLLGILPSYQLHVCVVPRTNRFSGKPS
jgi:hypothetical protein